ncbi:MAG TPA: nucleotidyltransferase family protein [Pseudonocardia sp.]|nr:nucleotidyltransferase family protein [Pseudonocardia sp.]
MSDRPAGLLLAAGAGRRMGRPKALVELDGTPLVRRALAALVDGGCCPLVVVVGAQAEDVAALVGDDALVVTAEDWASGMGASLRAGLAALAGMTEQTGKAGQAGKAGSAGPSAAVVHLVDLPGVGPEAIARLAAAATGPEVLARAVYGGRPGHPVLIGRAHWDAVRAEATGDQGARGYLAGHPGLEMVECGDIADPRDVDTPGALEAFRS